jgi:hypothetical protein
VAAGKRNLIFFPAKKAVDERWEAMSERQKFLRERGFRTRYDRT